MVPQPQFNCAPSTATTFATQVAVPIPDEASASSPITVSGLSGKVYDIDVTTNIAHTDPGDLLIALVSPTGKRVELSLGNGAGTVNVFAGTTWDDDANPGGSVTTAPNEGLVADHTYSAGVVATPLVPQEALAAFNGDDANGVWTLAVDDLLAGDTGTIVGWSLAIATNPGSFGPSTNGSSANAVATIPDGGSVAIPLTVAAGERRLESINNLNIHSFSYTGLGDLAMTVQSPAGTIVTLTRGNGLSTNAFASTLRWSIPTGAYVGFGTPDPITDIDFDVTVLPPSVAPEESFGAFMGEDPNGTWILTARDAGVIAGGGSLSGWSLFGRGSQCAGDAVLTNVTAPPVGLRIGAPTAYSATVTSTGVGHVRDASLFFALDRAFRVTKADPGVGGTCFAQRTSTTNTVSCKWADPVPPGQTRTATIKGEEIVVGLGTRRSTVTMRVSPVVAGQGFSPITATYPLINFGPAAERAFTGQRCTVVGTPGPDNFRTVPRRKVREVLCGRGGKDLIEGSPKGDIIDGGPGNDFLRGSAVADKIGGGPGNDQIYGGGGNDDLRGGPGKDKLFGEGGRDRLNGGPGADLLSGGAGVDSAIADALDRLLGIEIL